MITLADLFFLIAAFLFFAAGVATAQRSRTFDFFNFAAAALVLALWRVL